MRAYYGLFTESDYNRHRCVVGNSFGSTASNAVRKQTEKDRGEYDSAYFRMVSETKQPFKTFLCLARPKKYGNSRSPIRVPETRSVSHRDANETLSVVAMRVCNPDCL